MTELILVRHGEATWTVERRLQGQSDSPLTDNGRLQVARLKLLLDEIRPDTVVCSPLHRASQTASVLGFEPTTIDARWAEADLGEWSGRLIDELERDDGDAYRRWREGRHTPPGGESWDALMDRVGSAAEELLARDGAHLVVTHGGPIRAVCARFLGLQPDAIVPVAPASLTVIRMLDRPRLLAFNLTGDHLPAVVPD